MIWFFSPSERESGLVESMITAPRDFLELLFVLAMIACVFISPVVIIFEMVRLMMGIPKAPQEPSDTVRRFYSKTINEYLSSPDVDPEAYIYLLSQARKQFLDIDGFINKSVFYGKCFG